MSAFDNAYEQVRKVREKRDQILEDFAKAYLAGTGFPIDQIELVEQEIAPSAYDRMYGTENKNVVFEHRFWFRKRDNLPRISDNADVVPGALHEVPLLGGVVAKPSSAERQVEYLMALGHVQYEKGLKEIDRLTQDLAREASWAKHLQALTRRPIWTAIKNRIYTWVGRKDWQTWR